MTWRGARVALAALAPALLVGVACAPGTAAAHSLASSSVRVVVGEDHLDATVSLAVATLDQAFDAAHRSDVLTEDQYARQVTAYVDEHVTFTGADGATWVEQWGDPQRATTEGIETLTLDVEVDPAGADPSAFSVTYDALIEAVPGHEAVLVLETAAGSVSTPGVFGPERSTIAVGDRAGGVAMWDMVTLGFHHVLDGADHLLFLLTLLLPAPFVVASRRWRRRADAAGTGRRVLHVVSAFTLGHSLTLAATALGWLAVPARPVEILIGLSVAVSAVHAIRPLVRGGEPVIAAVFGLVHGLAFAGILADLGLRGRTSVLALLAFNLGIELAQLVTVALVLPSLYVLTTRARGQLVRVGGAMVALVAATAWVLDRSSVIADPFAGVETAVVAHLWWVVIGLAGAALLTVLHRDRSLIVSRPDPDLLVPMFAGDEVGGTARRVHHRDGDDSCAPSIGDHRVRTGGRLSRVRRDLEDSECECLVAAVDEACERVHRR